MNRLGAMGRILELCKSGSMKGPTLIGSSIGMQWATFFTEDRKNMRIFVIGPVFYTSVSENQIRDELPPEIADGVCGMIESIHTVPNAVLLNHVINIYNALTGQSLNTMELYSGSEVNIPLSTRSTVRRDREKVYLAEQAMLRTVREGNINYRSAFMKSIEVSQGVPIHGKDPLRQAKTSLVVMETLISRAAMEGGLNPEIAYSLGDSYLKAIENSEDSGELFSLANAMFRDFVYRVHRTKNDRGYSNAVQKCCDFIEISQGRRITAYDLSVLCGYSEYYITEKFKKETGLSLNEYIRLSKVEKAKNMLDTTSMTIKEIASQLAFNTTNYFIQSFKAVTGMTPTQYRKKL
ncbi:MAG: AraC family transcriptional regulator [Sphaerochaetaceae bacterium]|nr:AraC family transcriptional regulator [Sphaerochaetaceae bacterium]